MTNLRKDYPEYAKRGNRISSHAQFDDERYWRFSRNSRLPRGTFDRSWEDVGHWWAPIVAVACVLIALIALVARA